MKKIRIVGLGSGATIVWMSLIVLIVFACDSLEQDVQKPVVNVTKNEVKALSTTSTTIDLRSRIQTNQSVSFSITRPTTNGTLEIVDAGLLNYKPNPGTTRDSFGFRILDEHKTVLADDSVVIVIVKDSTELPCAPYPVDDVLYIDSTAGGYYPNAYIYPLLNDFICAKDTSNVHVTVFRPESGYFPPYYGTATATSDNAIGYTVGPNFTGSDEIYYAITVGTDSAVIGRIHVRTRNTCVLSLRDDYFFRQLDSAAYDSARFNAIMIPVFSNDRMGCWVDSMSVSLIYVPTKGEAYITPAGVYYTPNSWDGGYQRDSVRYRVCKDAACQEAGVAILLKR